MYILKPHGSHPTNGDNHSLSWNDWDTVSAQLIIPAFSHHCLFPFMNISVGLCSS